jgi:1,4-alpha-glucan branching enzyme
MPVTHVKEEVEWGYTPLGYFAPDERLGGAEGMRRLVNACHERGIAVVLDAVYAHAHPEFAYNLVYDSSGEPNPMMGVFAEEFFSGRPGTDYAKEFTRDYFFELNRYWLREYHVDGFRYDYVPGMYDGPLGRGYADLVYRTYQDSRSLARFAAGGGRSKLIQCAEHLPDPVGILSRTYSNCAWQNGLLDVARDMARRSYVSGDFAHRLDPEFVGYPSEYRDPASGETFPVAPFQYIESHDHPRFVNELGRLEARDLLGEPYGDRSRCYKMQPYVIGLYTGKGIPMLWNGQEFGENWGVPSWGIGRNLFERPLHWEYFYDAAGKALVRLHRILGELRRKHRALGSRGSFYYYAEQAHLERGVIAFRREAPQTGAQPAERLLVLLNFTDRDAEVWVPFPAAGTWTEQIDGTRPAVTVAAADPWAPIVVPSNYGGVYLHA